MSQKLMQSVQNISIERFVCGGGKVFEGLAAHTMQCFSDSKINFDQCQVTLRYEKR